MVVNHEITAACPMPALLLTFAILAMWFVHGFGVAHRFVPAARGQPLLLIVLATWFGLIANLLVLIALYFLVPHWTIGDLAWPVTLGLAAISLGLTLGRPRPQFTFNAHDLAIVVFVAFAVVLVLRPLVDQSHLGFYESNNGEFLNYAAIADSTQFHEASFPHPGFSLRSREGVAGIACATICAIANKAAIWVILPFSAALAAIAFASIGLVFRHIVVQRRAGQLGSVIAGLVYLFMIWSVSTTYFWSLSFVSQYLGIAIWLPLLVFLIHVSQQERTTTAILGVALGAMICVYPEMAAPNVALIGAYQVASAKPGARLRTIALFVVAVAVAFVISHPFHAEILRKASKVGTTGWSMYGPNRPVLGFIAHATGFTNMWFRPYQPTHYSALPVAIAAVGFGGSLVYSAIRAWREAEPTLRGLFCLGSLFYVGVFLAFAIVVKRGDDNNYVVTKVLTGFGCLGYFLLALTLIDLVRWRRKLAFVPVVFMLALCPELARNALAFAKLQHRAPLYVESDGEAVRKQLRGRRPMIVASMYSGEIVGRFMVYERNVVSVDGQWPGQRGQYTLGAPVIVVGDGKLSSVKEITGNYWPVWWIGNVVLFEPLKLAPGRDLR